MSDSVSTATSKDAEDPSESELFDRRWSVISFERLEKRSLSYPEAVAALQDLEKRGVPGLCIVTDEAAARLKPQE